MKKEYRKPTFTVEYYTLTQSIASCSGIKIGFANSECVLNDNDATPMMKDWANVGGFISANGKDGCAMDLSGFTEGSIDDMMCYFTSMNASFMS